ncbi:sugar ABC transporter permease [Herbiconiux moechotypicola]|uniref:Sugar ABC transporter permease n=1 Tax=Herbiconiux moechotypicola TaxID=637393 RepID=A0ABN3E677_9MICO|nr:sugar ABC transporter permease [Herbiconiux moechotypicola]MCS5731897.1 sugar ABC transporter permease [Herbiconiux moechotypicola]
MTALQSRLDVEPGATGAGPNRPAPAAPGRRRRALRRHPRSAPYLFIAPFFVVFLPFGAGSVLLALGMAFVTWPLGQAPVFVGGDNFATVLTDPLFGKAMGNTVYMLAGFLLALMPLALFVAVLLKQLRKRSANIVQVLVFAPITMSLIAVALVFDLILNERVGFVSGVLAQFGLDPIPFLSDAGLAPWSIILLRIWRVLGYYAVILFAGLQSIPDEYYEAAALDGANAWQRFRHITFPLLKPVTLFVLVAASIAAWELFAEVDVLTDGGPARSTLTAVMYIFQASFGQFDLGKGAAASAVLAVAIIVSTLLANRLLRSDDRDR